MVAIDAFRAKWAYFKARGRAARISVHLRRSRLSYHKVAMLLPREASGRFPATGEDDNLAMSGAGFGDWLKQSRVPDDRIAQFEALTGMAITDWSSGIEQFESIVRRAAGEVTDWARYLDGAKTGKIRVHAFDAETASRFTPAGARRREGSSPTWVWPGCRAYVEIPKNGGFLKSGSERRAWMVADYSSGELYVLDPTIRSDGRASDSRCGSETRLPRGHGGFVELQPEVVVGTSFTVAVLIVDLEEQVEEVIAAFDGLEERLRTPVDQIFSAARHRDLRKVLDDVATLIADARVAHALYAERCIVVDRRDRPAMRRDGV